MYELLNSENEEDTKSRIRLVKSENKEIADSLQEYYSQNSVKEDEVIESFYEMESEAEAKSLAEYGFSLKKSKMTPLRSRWES